MTKNDVFQVGGPLPVHSTSFLDERYFVWRVAVTWGLHHTELGTAAHKEVNGAEKRL